MTQVTSVGLPHFSGRVTINHRRGSLDALPAALRDNIEWQVGSLGVEEGFDYFGPLRQEPRPGLPKAERRAIYKLIRQVRDTIATDGDDAMHIQFVGVEGFGKVTARIKANYPAAEYLEWPGCQMASQSVSTLTYADLRHRDETLADFKTRLLEGYQNQKQFLDQHRTRHTAAQSDSLLVDA